MILLCASLCVTCRAEETEVIDTTKCIFILDSSIVYARYIMEHFDKLKFVGSVLTVREAVMYSGGELRKPYFIYRTKEEGEDE